MTDLRKRQANLILDNIIASGAEGGFVVEVDNGEWLVAKPQSDYLGLRIGPNEVLAALVGLAIGGPFLEPELVYIDQDVIELSRVMDSPTLKNSLRPGLCFGTKFLQKQVSIAVVSENLASVENSRQAIPLLILDSWLHNTDRINPGNLMFVASEEDNKQRKMYAIDHGLIFGSWKWQASQLIAEKNQLRVEDHLPIISKLARQNISDLNEFLKKAEMLTKDDLTFMLNQFPPEWQITKTDQDTLLDYLLTRQSLLRPEFEKFFWLC